MAEKTPTSPKPKVVILTAGKGSRLGERTKYFNKALLRVGDLAVISHTIIAFPDDYEFVIALGYKGNIVRQYLETAHPDKNFTFVEIDKYSVPGAGPGYAMLQCKDQIPGAFYFVSCDSIVNWGGKIYDLDHFMYTYPNCFGNSWVAYREVLDPENYCTLDIVNGKVYRYWNKSKDGPIQAFIGVAHVNEEDVQQFWCCLEQETVSEEGEIQIAPAFMGVDLMSAVRFCCWYDTGSEEGLRNARADFKGIQNLDKLDEELYVVNDHVVKYFHNKSMVKNRVARAKNLGEAIPEIVAHSDNFYKYKFVPGKDLFATGDPHKIMKELLIFTNDKLWSQTKELDEFESLVFKDVCKKFYYDKTLSRLKKFYEKTGIKDQAEVINDEGVPALTTMFRNINWDYLAGGIPGSFHGDYHFSNIIMGDDQSFKFVDWRQDFGGSIEYGDVYYDLAKMYHAFLFPHPIVKQGKYYFEYGDLDGDGPVTVKTFIETPYAIERSKDVFESFLRVKGYDLWKVRVLTAIVLLNMSPLHEPPMDRYLYYFGKYYLNKVLHA